MHFMSKQCFFLTLLLATTAILFAQEADEDNPPPTESTWRPSTAIEIETLLRAHTVTYAQAARFVLEASNTMTTAVHEDAFQYAQEQGWLPKNAEAGDTARLDGIAFLLMRSFGLKGGIFYTLIPNPRYAYRELAYIDAIQGRADPAMAVSGEKLLFITGRILSKVEN